MSHLLGVPSVLCTHFVEARTDILRKVSRYLDLLKAVCPRLAGMPVASVEDGELLRCMRRGGVVVISDTPRQLRVVADRLEQLRRDEAVDRRGGRRGYVWMQDEADAQLKSNAPAWTKAWRRLERIEQPLLSLQVSGTPVACLGAVRNKARVFARHLFCTTPSSDYVSVDSCVCPLRVGDADVFLRDDELRPGNGYSSDGVRAMHAQVASAPGALHIHLVTDRVTGASNNTRLAELMQAQHPGVSAVVAWGGGVKYRKLAGDDWVVHRRLRGAAQVQTVVDAIAALHDDDPARPITVFGYLTIARGLSVRTSTRVVTHLTAWFSDGRNIECVLQAIGRAFGDCKAALAALGFGGVVVLTRSVDFDSAMSHPRFMRDLVDAMAAGDSLAASWRAEYGAGCDFMSRQRRSLGPKRLRLALECTFVEGAAEGRGLTADRMAAAEALARAGMDADAALVCLVAQSLMKAHKVSVIAVDPAFLEAGRKELAWPVVFPRDGLATFRAAVAAMADAGRAPSARRAAAFSSCLADGTMVVEAALLDDDTNSVCIMDPRRLGRSPDAEDKLLRLALSGAEQFNSTQSLAQFLETHRLGPKNLPSKALARFQKDLGEFADAFPQLFTELTEDVEERWTRERLVRVCRAARLAASPDAALGADDLVAADAFSPPSRRALAFRTLPLMVGLGADGRRLPCGLPDAAAGGGDGPAEFVLALHALQALRRRSAPAAAARAPGSASKKRRGGSAPLPAAPAVPEPRDFASPCGCGASRGCPCGCATAEEHVAAMRTEFADKLRPDNADGHCRLIRALKGAGEGRSFSRTDLTALVRDHGITGRYGSKPFQVNVINLLAHNPWAGAARAGHSYARHGRVLVHDERSSTYALNPWFWGHA